jgi:hypothetical protein
LFTANFSGNVNRIVAQDLAKQYDVDNFVKLPEGGPKNSYVKAILDATKGFKKDNCPFVIDKVSENVDFVEHVVVKREVVDDISVDPVTNLPRKTSEYQVEARIRFYKDTNKNPSDMLEFPENRNHPMCLRVKDLYEQNAVIYSSNDLRFACLGALESLKAVKVLRGNLYFVLASEAQFVRNLVQFITALGGDNVALVMPQIDNSGTKRMIQVAAQQTLEDQFETLKEQISAYKAGDTRPSTFSKRLAEFAQLRETIALYNSAVKLDLQDLENGISECEDSLLASMNQTSASA